MKKARRRIDVNLEELDRVLDGAREASLSEADHDKLKDALHALAALLVRTRNTEKTSEVLEKAEVTFCNNNLVQLCRMMRSRAATRVCFLRSGKRNCGSGDNHIPTEDREQRGRRRRSSGAALGKGLLQPRGSRCLCGSP
jgi:hypothetical protein